MKDGFPRREELIAAALTGDRTEADRRELAQAQAADPSMIAELEELRAITTRLDGADISWSEEALPSGLEFSILAATVHSDDHAARRCGSGPAQRARLATPEDLDAAADTLTAAFMDYPWTRHVIPEPGYAQRVHRLQHLYLDHARQHGLLIVTDSVEGVLALLPPHPPEPAPAVIEQILALHGDRVDRLTQSFATPSAWRLETLGVHPESQGRGLATELLDLGFQRAAGLGARSIALETSDPRNVRLYERHDFAVTSRVQAPGAPPVWHMMRSIQFS